MNFALILFILLVISFVAWLIDVLWLARQRRAAAERAVAEFDRKNQARTGAAVELLAAERSVVRDSALRRPWYMEYTASFFPVILAVFVLRSFLFEPFRIPSGSMIPTLEIGDLILVNKYQYGIRLPVINKKMIEVGSPQRGDVMVSRRCRCSRWRLTWMSRACRATRSSAKRSASEATASSWPTGQASSCVRCSIRTPMLADMGPIRCPAPCRPATTS